MRPHFTFHVRHFGVGTGLGMEVALVLLYVSRRAHRAESAAAPNTEAVTPQLFWSRAGMRTFWTVATWILAGAAVVPAVVLPLAVTGQAAIRCLCWQCRSR